MRRRDRKRAGNLLVGGALAWLGWQAIQKLREQSLAGHVVLVTGGSRGLGLLLAHEFASEGCRVVICARDEEELRQAAADLEDRGARVLALTCDVSDRLQVQEMVRQATEHFGRVDVLVNNAGVIQVGPASTMTLGDFEDAMDVMFWGSVYATMAVLPQMRARGTGRIVNVTSIGGKVAVPHLLPYDCAKFATVALSEGLRAELAGEGIAVTTIVPGLMRTGSQVNAWFKGDREREYTWFAASGSTPLTAMDAGRAARRIVAAARRGEAEVTLTWQATLLRITHGLFPGAVAEILGVVNRALPHAEPRQRTSLRGMEVGDGLPPEPIAGLVRRAALETNQYAGAQPLARDGGAE